MNEKNENVINCFECVHFAVTWEQGYPKSCKLFGFKTVQMPSAAVFETTGEACLGFEKKTTAGSVRSK